MPGTPPFPRTGTGPPTACAHRFLHILGLPWGQLVQPQDHWPQLQQPWTCPTFLGCPVLGCTWCGGSGLLLPALLCQGEAPEPPVQGVALHRNSLRCPKPARWESSRNVAAKPRSCSLRNVQPSKLSVWTKTSSPWSSRFTH